RRRRGRRRRARRGGRSEQVPAGPDHQGSDPGRTEPQGGLAMDIDMAALRAIERDRDISTDYLLQTLEDAILNAYNKTDHALRGVKIDIDRRTGKVSVLAPEFGDDDEIIGYFDDTPEDFGRVAASTARQVITQRIREAEDDQKYGHF